LVALTRVLKMEQVIFAYSDVSYEYTGAGYTMLKSSKSVVSVCAVRTGSGKSQTTRRARFTQILSKIYPTLVANEV